ncbi:vacuolar protein sorting associated protein [Scheffersomyces coipomensis]|uniref:vacuolar protein sorting associated protein n=1 Tax=Scheffersomyces coipomensis TaxID=1788519 RepID=UPI00315C897A
MTLNLSKISEAYFKKLFLPKSLDSSVSPESKSSVLVLDQFTTSIISMCYTQTQLLQNNVILVELLDNYRSFNKMKHLNCIVYIKPTKESIQAFINELSNPHFKSYQLFLNNTINKTQLERLAEADEFEVINQVVEVFQDYLIINSNLFTINLPSNSPTPSSSNSSIVEESNSLISLLLSLKKCPIIKYEPSSIDLKRLSSEILYNINSNSNNNLFDDLNKGSDRPPILLLLDRKTDPITPLISPWTYQSMIHEYIGVKKNIAEVANEQLILDETQDTFFKESMYLNYGDLTDKFQNYVEYYKKETKQTSIENLQTQNLNELKKMLTKFPEFKKLSSNILKHLNIISEIDKEVNNQNMWEIGELQQTIICELDNHQNIKSRLIEILDNSKITTINKIKLVLLFSIRFHNTNDLSLFTAKLNDITKTNPSPTVSQNALLKKFNALFSSKISTTSVANTNANNLGNIFANKTINIPGLFNNNRNNRNQSKNDNIYLQYVPKLNEILADLITPNQETNSGTTLSTLVPDVVANQYGRSIQYEPVQDIIIYIKGGVTYEEARLIRELSASNKKINLIIGGDSILNSSNWLNYLYDLVNDSSTTDVISDPTEERRKQLRDLL